MAHSSTPRKRNMHRIMPPFPPNHDKESFADIIPHQRRQQEHESDSNKDETHNDTDMDTSGTVDEIRSVASACDSAPSAEMPEDVTAGTTKLQDLARTKRSEFALLRSKLNFCSTPITITKYFLIYVAENVKSTLKYLRYQALGWLMVLGILAASLWIIYSSDGPHQKTIAFLESALLWYGYWLALGVASSIGLGTGLHTFVLFLGPFIARVTLTAYRCGSLDFDTKGPDSFQCVPVDQAVTVWQISSKLRCECLSWGAGAAFGELPPYFVARAAAAAGRDDQSIASIENLRRKSPSSLSFSERAQVGMYSMLVKFGFIGIVLCASIPNPLFDLAGIICGRFSISFWTFFGATFVGKAIIKSTIQSFAVIILFSNDILEDVVMAWLKRKHPSIHASVRQMLDSQLRQFSRHEVAGSAAPAAAKVRTSTFSYIWNLVLLIMVGYFIISIIESLAISQIRQLHEQEISNMLKESQ
ncbi:hypothetical protein SeLEV6574_g00434 [Synchytrium endobioticum]|uniref:Golgi apparatus membrane protein TVP38 n=1 Tax=Synchytrium endobioticum TaxID=286115 RepID=A0A507DHK9_9FUNG|nr:hypothetical protein SeLEV6574_g00434 [Synchytrium endobioticum]